MQQVENEDAAPVIEPTGVLTVKIVRLVPLLAQIPGSLAVAHFGVVDEAGQVVEKQVLVRGSYLEPGSRAVFVPVNSVLPDEPEFSFLGAARRRLRTREVGGQRSDGLLISYEDVACIMARRAVRMAQTEEEVALLTSKDADYLWDAARAALQEIPLGVDIGESLGIYPYVEPTAEEAS